MNKPIVRKCVRPSDKMQKLLKDSAAGNAEAMFEMAKLVYWEYEELENGLNTETQVLELLAAAGAAGDAALKRKIAKFLQCEFQYAAAEQLHRGAFVQTMERAAQQDAEAQYEIGLHYAFGEGVPQSEEKAVFWCRLAARNGHGSARQTLEKFLCGDHTDRSARIPALDELETLAVQYQTLESRELAASYAADKEISRQYVIRDLSAPPMVRLRNKICSNVCSLLVTGAILYVLLSQLSLLCVWAFGYSESGLMHWISEGFEAMLGIPFRWGFQWKRGAADGLTLQYICERIAVGSLFEAALWIVGLIFLWFIIVPVILITEHELVLSMLAWYVLVIGGVWLAYKLVNSLKYYGMRIEVSPLKKSELKKRQQLLTQIQQERDEVGRRFQTKCNDCGIPQSMRSAAVVMDVLRFARQQGIRDPKQAVRRYTAPTGQYSPRISAEDGRLGYYFVLRNQFGADMIQQILAGEKKNMDVDGAFVRGYRLYRRGQRFDLAEQSLNRAFGQNGAGSEEQGWAAWLLAKLYRTEKMPLEELEYKDYALRCKEAENAAERWTQKAIQNDCPMVNVTNVHLCRQLLLENQEMVYAVAKNWSGRDVVRGEYWKKIAAAERAVRTAFGEPFGRRQWEEYSTKCVWPEINSIFDQYKYLLKKTANSDGLSADSKSNLRDQWNELMDRVRAVKGCGVYIAEKLYEKVERWRDLYGRQLDHEAARKEQQNRQRFEAREAAVRAQMDQFDANADRLERSINRDWGDGTYDTNLERLISGRMSQTDYMAADDVRYRARQKYRAQVERDYDAQTSSDDEE